MFGPLVKKLQRVVELTDSDRHALEGLGGRVRRVGQHVDLISEGDRPDYVHLMVEGWAARYKSLPDGTRQITAFLIPGDFCDLHVTVLEEMDHSITAITPAAIACLPHEQMRKLTRDNPRLVTALWWATLVDEAVLRAWIVNIGRRPARERIAHLICELNMRMSNVELGSDRAFILPLTQQELSDALGITPVHTNRMLQSLRAERVISWRSGAMEIHDLDRLRTIAGFDPNYLHARKLRGNSGNVIPITQFQ